MKAKSVTATCEYVSLSSVQPSVMSGCVWQVFIPPFSLREADSGEQYCVITAVSLSQVTHKLQKEIGSCAIIFF